MWSYVFQAWRVLYILMVLQLQNARGGAWLEMHCTQFF
jgi:hypothetical protein